MSDERSFHVYLARYRKQAGISQQTLADDVGVSRQTISDIENQRHVPGTDLSLRLANRLGVSVEELFSVSTKNQYPSKQRSSDGIRSQRIRQYSVDGREIIQPLTGSSSLRGGLNPADGQRDLEGTIHWFAEEINPEHRLLFMGCDPALGILVDVLNQSIPDFEYHWLYGSSHQSLEAVRRREVHLAGIHFPGEDWADSDGEQSIPTDVIRFTQWEQGLAVAPGNPLEIHGIEDLPKPEVRLVNRSPGSGIRQWLDRRLAENNIPPAAIEGYDNTVPSHTDVVRSVASGQADVGVTMRSVAELFDLGFVPLEQVAFDFLRPDYARSHPPLEAMLQELSDRSLRDQIDSLPGYSTDSVGETFAQRPIIEE